MCQLIQQSEGHFQTEGSLIRSHCSKAWALSSYREFPFEKRGLQRTEEKGGKGRGEASEEEDKRGELVEVRWSDKGFEGNRKEEEQGLFLFISLKQLKCVCYLQVRSKII